MAPDDMDTEEIAERIGERLKDPKVIVALVIAAIGIGVFIGTKLAAPSPFDFQVSDWSQSEPIVAQAEEPRPAPPVYGVEVTGPDEE